MKNTNINEQINAKLAAEAILNNAPVIGNYRFCSIPTTMLKTHDTIQRPLRGHEKQIAAQWNNDKCAPLTVSYHADEGKFIVIDGQHRLAAAKIAGVGTLICRVFENLTIEQEAKLFAAQTEHFRRLTLREVFKAHVTARDPIALGLKALCDEYGYFVLCGTDNDRPVMIAFNQLWQSYRIHGEQIVRFFFDTLRDSGWCTDPKATGNDVTRALLRIWRWRARFTAEELAYLPKMLQTMSIDEFGANAVLMYPRGAKEMAMSRYMEYRMTHDEIPAEAEQETERETTAVILGKPTVA